MFLTTSFYDINQKILSKKKVISKISVDSNVHWQCFIDYCVELSLFDETLCKKWFSFHKKKLMNCTSWRRATNRCKKFKFSGGRTCFGDIWIFAKFLIGLHGVFNPFRTAHILCIDNFKSIWVLGWTPLKILIFLHWSLLSLLRFSENAMLFHIEWLCRKTMWNVNRPPYSTSRRFWVWPASFANFEIFESALYMKSGSMPLSLTFSYNRQCVRH